MEETLKDKSDDSATSDFLLKENTYFSESSYCKALENVRDIEFDRVDIEGNAHCGPLVRLPFASLFDTLGMYLADETAILLLYSLVHGNSDFLEYALVRKDLDTLLMPMLETLYNASKGTSHQIYMVLIILLVLSQDSSFNASIHKLMLPSVPWYQERLLHQTSLGSLMIIILKNVPCFVGSLFSWFLVLEGLVISKAGVEGQVKSNNMDRGMISPDTYIVFQASNSSGMKIVNQRKAASSDIFKHKEFNLESLGIGGLSAEFADIFRRAFASRVFPPHVTSKLGIKHVKGMLLYGPPGTGKTLMARQIGKMLNGKEPKIVNGPEVLSKFVGETVKNVRDLFADAEQDQRTQGDQSDLHVIIFDEIDAICKSRGSTRDGTGVHDSIVNQLLTKIDGVESLNNVLLIGMTNRKDLLDEALLRLGRLEVEVEISLLDEHGRLQIIQIHTNKIKENCTRLLGNMSIFGRIKYFWMDVYG